MIDNLFSHYSYVVVFFRHHLTGVLKGRTTGPHTVHFTCEERANDWVQAVRANEKNRHWEFARDPIVRSNPFFEDSE